MCMIVQSCHPVHPRSNSVVGCVYPRPSSPFDGGYWSVNRALRERLGLKPKKDGVHRYDGVVEIRKGGFGDVRHAKFVGVVSVPGIWGCDSIVVAGGL